LFFHQKQGFRKKKIIQTKMSSTGSKTRAVGSNGSDFVFIQKPVLVLDGNNCQRGYCGEDDEAGLIIQFYLVSICPNMNPTM